MLFIYFHLTETGCRELFYSSSRCLKRDSCQLYFCILIFKQLFGSFVLWLNDFWHYEMAAAADERQKLAYCN